MTHNTDAAENTPPAQHTMDPAALAAQLADGTLDIGAAYPLIRGLECLMHAAHISQQPLHPPLASLYGLVTAQGLLVGTSLGNWGDRALQLLVGQQLVVATLENQHLGLGENTPLYEKEAFARAVDALWTPEARATHDEGVRRAALLGTLSAAAEALVAADLAAGEAEDAQARAELGEPGTSGAAGAGHGVLSAYLARATALGHVVEIRSMQPDTGPLDIQATLLLGWELGDARTTLIVSQHLRLVLAMDSVYSARVGGDALHLYTSSGGFVLTGHPSLRGPAGTAEPEPSGEVAGLAEMLARLEARAYSQQEAADLRGFSETLELTILNAEHAAWQQHWNAREDCWGAPITDPGLAANLAQAPAALRAGMEAYHKAQYDAGTELEARVDEATLVRREGALVRSEGAAAALDALLETVWTTEARAVHVASLAKLKAVSGALAGPVAHARGGRA